MAQLSSQLIASRLTVSLVVTGKVLEEGVLGVNREAASIQVQRGTYGGYGT